MLAKALQGQALWLQVGLGFAQARMTILERGQILHGTARRIIGGLVKGQLPNAALHDTQAIPLGDGIGDPGQLGLDDGQLGLLVDHVACRLDRGSQIAFVSAGIAFLSSAFIFIPMARSGRLTGKRLLIGGVFYLAYLALVIAALAGVV